MPPYRFLLTDSRTGEARLGDVLYRSVAEATEAARAWNAAPCEERAEVVGTDKARRGSEAGPGGGRLRRVRGG